MISQRTSTALAALLLAFLTSAACAAAPAPIALSPDQARTSGVTTGPVGAARAGEAVGEGLRLPGVVAFPNKAVQLVSAPADGVVEKVLVDTMEQVNAGAPLAVLRSPQLLALQREYIQASLQSSLATARLRRDQSLFDEGIIAESRLQESRSAQVHSIAAQRELQQTLKIAGMTDRAIAALAASHQLSPTLTVAAPRAGVVIEQLAAIGQRVEAGTPLAKIAQQDRLWIELQATRQQAALIRAGDAVQLAGCERPGRVAAIGAQLTAASQTLAIRVELPAAASCVRPNQHVEGVVRVRGSQEPAWLVKPSALAASGGKDYVFVQEGAGFRPVEVQVVQRDATTAVLRGALQAGQRVAVSGVATLKGIWLGLGAEGK